MESNVGQLLESSKISITKQYTPEKTVSFIDVSCGCMNVKYSKTSGTIKLVYSAGILDQRTIQTKGFQEIHRYLTVHFTDGTTEKINVTGKIIKK